MSNPPPHPVHKGMGWDFSKLALMGGMGNFYQKWWGVGFIMGGMRNFLSLYLVGRRVLYCLPPPPFFLFQILSNPLSPASLSPPTSTPTVLSVVLLLWLNGWSCHIWCAILLNDNMNLHMSSLGTLIPEGPWCVFYATRHKVYWDLTYNVVFYWYSDLIPQTHKRTQHTWWPVDWQTHINVHLHHLLCA